MRLLPKLAALSISAVLATQSIAPVEASDSYILTSQYNLNTIRDVVYSIKDFTMYPKLDERERWDVIPEETQKVIIERGEAALKYKYTGIPFDLYASSYRTGDRSEFSRVQLEARSYLVDLVVAEGVENKGRFIEPAAGLAWKITEDATWAARAHLYLQAEKGEHAEFMLPDPHQHVVGLRTASAAKNLAWTRHILGDKFDEISPFINIRIEKAIRERMLEPAKRDDFWWMGYSGGNGGIVNNWNPWISSNWLASALLIEDDPREKAEAIYRIMRTVDRFINTYAEDGGIDEGPGYWAHAGATMFEVLDLLYVWSEGQINMFDHPKIRNIFQYIYRANIDEDYAVNFADAQPRVTPPVGLLYRIGTRIGDEKMVRFARYYMDWEDSVPAGHGPSGDIDRTLYELLNNTRAELAKVEPELPYLRDVWLNDIQQLYTRSKEGSAKGFFMAAKGGTNFESHNHNDVGNFTVYYDGKPVLIDAGVETYTTHTFGPNRYDLWNMRSDYHNLPTINGVLQKDGVSKQTSYRAQEVVHEINDEFASLSMDIAAAYPPEAGVNNWNRKVTLNRQNGITLEESFSLSKLEGDTSLNLLTPRQVTIGESQMTLKARGEKDIKVSFEPGRFDIDVETFKLDDPKMSEGWKQDKVYRIVMTAKNIAKDDSWKLEIRDK